MREKKKYNNVMIIAILKGVCADIPKQQQQRGMKMRLTKMFYESTDDIAVDEQINDFVKENDYEIVDVKYQLANSGFDCVLLIYEVKDNE